jgi:hypothetical protein
MHSFSGRLLIGLLLAQGLYFGFRHLLSGVLLSWLDGEDLQEVWQSPLGLVLLESLQLLPLLLAGLLAGSGQRHGFVLGFLIGLCNSVLCMFLQVSLANPATAIAWYLPPLLHGVLGSLGGWVGSTIWKPLVIPTLPTAPGQLGRKMPVARRRLSLFAGRVAWFRVVLGAALAVAGSLSAEFLLDAALNASQGKLETTTRMQDRIFTWEIRALCILVGAALAGATTSNGLKQGLVVGLLVTCGLLAMAKHPGTVELAGLTALSSIMLSLAGGWFGSQLLPPVWKVRNSDPSGVAPEPT